MSDVLTEQAASDAIKDLLASDEPALVGRLGDAELGALLNFLAIQRDRRPVRRALLRAAGRSPATWTPRTISELTNNAGFFPPETDLLERFCSLMLADISTIDILGSWIPREADLQAYLSNATKVRLRDLEPYYHRDPWSEVLAGRTVLVIHPFARSIEAQYARRDALFDNPRVLPSFELRVLPAVQSIAGTPTAFPTWFDAYDHMCDEMSKIAFDIAIIGCGAYGLPLAAHAKRLGKKGVHLGGAVQILFGIKGKRWDEHETISRLYNEHWVRPEASERPEGYRQVEDGCYW